MKQDQIVIYQTEDGKTHIDVRLENETVWLACLDVPCKISRIGLPRTR